MSRITQTSTLIADAMRENTPPWRTPFVAHKNNGFPTNAYTNRQYGGINPLLLNIAAIKNGFTSKFWATYKQWTGLGCQVKCRPDDVPEGEWATKIVRRVYSEEADKVSWSSILVFNAAQVFGNFHLVPATAYQVFNEEVSKDGPDYGNVDKYIDQLRTLQGRWLQQPTVRTTAEGFHLYALAEEVRG